MTIKGVHNITLTAGVAYIAYGGVEGRYESFDIHMQDVRPATHSFVRMRLERGFRPGGRPWFERSLSLNSPDDPDDPEDYLIIGWKNVFTFINPLTLHDPVTSALITAVLPPMTAKWLAPENFTGKICLRLATWNNPCWVRDAG